MHPWADAGRVIVGRYRLEAPIGRGAMGVVWRARDLLLDRDVAVKEVQIAETLTDEERANAFQRTLREAKTAARLNHPGVVTVYDVAEDEGRPWIVMQLVHAQSLDQVLATSGPLSPRRAAEMGRQLLSALSVAHAAGVMHRDVKPSNVLLGRDDRAVLTDFGIATFQGDPRLTQTGMVMGSPGFTAPERIRGEDASPASDLWSLGATLFAAVEGHGPFEKRGSAITTMSAIINEDAPPASSAGPLAPVIAALLHREPADRPDAAAATRMITDALPPLSAPASSGSTGYVPTALSAASRPASAPPGTPGPSETSRDFGPVGHTAGMDPLGSMAAADTRGGEPSAAGTAATTPQPVLDDAARSGQAGDVGPTVYRKPAQDDHPATTYDPQGQRSQAAAASGPAAAPPPDFSSWYDSSPRSGAAPSAQADPGWQAGSRYPQGGSPAGPGQAPWPGSAPPPGARPDYAPATAPPHKRRTGRWIALVLLAVLGAAAGAATIVLLRHDSGGTPSERGSTGTASTPAGTLPPATLQIVDAVNLHHGTLPSGWDTVTHQAAGGETAGFIIAAPSTWPRSTSSYQTYLRDPSANANILVDLTPHTYPNDMVKEAQYIKRQSLDQNRFPGYQELGLAATTIRGTKGSYWKFTWTDNGVQQEAIDLLFVLQTPAGPQSYALYMTAPASMWTQLRPTFDEAAETFAAQT
jgi:eukaryotic-like serine/threonine-protein kinase